jgi:two-component system, LytTR family, response regulator
MKALILDDELYCAEALYYLAKNHCPEIEELVYYTDPFEALSFLNTNKIDLLFLDIEMPFITGFDFLQKADGYSGAVVFTTAYENYALKAFQVDAIGYLLKPIDRKELKKTVSKVAENKTRFDHEALLKIVSNAIAQKKPESKKVPIHTSDGIHLIQLEQIIRCESDGSYSRIFTQFQKPMLVSKNLKELEELFESKQFFRIHKSHIINLDHIKFVSRQDGGEVIMSDEVSVPISRAAKQDFFNLFR